MCVIAKPAFVLVLETIEQDERGVSVGPLAQNIMADFLFCRMVLSVGSLTLQRMESLARLRRP